MIQDYSESEVLRCMFFIIDAIDPRISQARRLELIDESNKINSEITTTLLVNISAGLVDGVAEVAHNLSVIPGMTRDQWVSKYLEDFRKGTGTADMGMIFGE